MASPDAIYRHIVPTSTCGKVIIESAGAILMTARAGGSSASLPDRPGGTSTGSTENCSPIINPELRLRSGKSTDTGAGSFW